MMFNSQIVCRRMKSAVKETSRLETYEGVMNDLIVVKKSRAYGRFLK